MSAIETGDPGSPGEAEAAAALESPAYPRFIRILAIIVVVDLIGFGIWSMPALSGESWSAGSLALFGLAALCIGWTGFWIVNSRTRLEGDVLSQTWLWNKREDAADVAQLKLVHWRWLERVMAPRLLVRRRNGAVTWFHSADARLLTGFAERVAARGLAPPRR
ncbi:hypothetical protein [Variovorax saccharolyticus]|uniref:hypothetical protein n=1 Tax=Variovorax saccharolyticus TaxID=3053516 RepID=UPI00257874E8|nr:MULTISPECIES: hypothetical protein [unclassified Variovorax]MDM0016100.1 hypothetical protein [Variovorax sp. J22R187]MDM0027026.1 hypothetical protein [Variovorax sp. J31P216]